MFLNTAARGATALPAVVIGEKPVITVRNLTPQLGRVGRQGRKQRECDGDRGEEEHN